MLKKEEGSEGINRDDESQQQQQQQQGRGQRAGKSMNG